jgi:Pyruvate/2-oxoglutarate dehydrogenase complex, dihydrolipoamide acyltransferase (E2) component, and related enzymes
MDMTPPDKPDDGKPPPTRDYEGMRKIVGDHARLSLQSQAQMTLTTSADAVQITTLQTTFSQDATLPRLTILDFVVWAAAKNLKFFPRTNSCFHVPTEKIIEFVLPTIGIAFDMPDGQKIPVIEYTHRLKLFALAERLRQLQNASETSIFAPEQHQNSTFTIYHLGSDTAETSTPVNQYPQTASLGFSAVKTRVFLSLTINAQIVSEHEGARFLRDIVHSLENASTELAVLGMDESFYC